MTNNIIKWYWTDSCTHTHTHTLILMYKYKYRQWGVIEGSNSIFIKLFFVSICFFSFVCVCVLLNRLMQELMNIYYITYIFALISLHYSKKNELQHSLLYFFYLLIRHLQHVIWIVVIIIGWKMILFSGYLFR